MVLTPLNFCKQHTENICRAIFWFCTPFFSYLNNIKIYVLNWFFGNKFSVKLLGIFTWSECISTCITSSSKFLVVAISTKNQSIFGCKYIEKQNYYLHFLKKYHEMKWLFLPANGFSTKLSLHLRHLKHSSCQCKSLYDISLESSPVEKGQNNN